jgi:polyisoprenoid-binding protein YceI
MKRILLLPLLVSLTLAFSQAAEYIVDTSHSHVSFSIKHMMISNVKGEFKSFEADLDFDPQTKSFKKINASIDPSSIDTGIVKRDEHLKSADFFNVEKFNAITFEATSISADKIIGNLTMHGVTKEITLTPTIHGAIKDFQGNNRVGFSLEGKINRTDFGLTWNKLLESGGLVVGEEVKISVDIEAIEL